MFFLLYAQICMGMIVANIGKTVNGVGRDFRQQMWGENFAPSRLKKVRPFLN